MTNINLEGMYSAIDVETTGLHAGRAAITEIAVVNFDAHSVQEYFHTLVQPGRPVPLAVTRFNGISSRMLEGAPAWADVIEEVERLTAGRTLVAHNAHFDYSFLRHAFLQCGKVFERRIVCTLHWHRRLFPGWSSYTLPSLCRRWGIEVGQLHRALSDALAVMHLFHILCRHDTEGQLRRWLQQRRAQRLLPPKVTADQLQQLPEGPGVYYLLDDRDVVLYVGKALNLRQRVLQHFVSGSATRQRTALMSRISKVRARPCGSELMALLLEAAEIKRLFPPFNRAQKFAVAGIGLVGYYDGNQYHRLALQELRTGHLPLAAWPGLPEARRDLQALVTEYRLCPRLAGLQRTAQVCHAYPATTCDGACIGHIAPRDYNPRVAAAVQALNSMRYSGLIRTEGRHADEYGVVALQRGYCLGFGFVPRQVQPLVQEVQPWLMPVPHSSDVLQIIQRFLDENHSSLIPEGAAISAASG